jgi:hypothetical protein
MPQLHWRAVLGALVALAVLTPASAAGAMLTFGSLGTAATLAEPHPTDTAFWNATAGAIPVTGQVRSVSLRGCAEPAANGSSPFRVFHIQVLAPKAGGRELIKHTSQPLKLPVCGTTVSATTVTTYATRYVCVKPGDSVAFNDEGGFSKASPYGVPYEVFASAPGVTTDFFNGYAKTNNGDTIAPTALPGVQLLMQVVIGTGSDEGIICHYLTPRAGG